MENDGIVPDEGHDPDENARLVMERDRRLKGGDKFILKELIVSPEGNDPTDYDW